MRPAAGKDYHERIVRTLVYVQQRLDDDLTLEEAAGVAAFSAFHFHRVFRGLVGEPCKEHIRRLRLERAPQRLKRLDEPVTGPALDAGFESHERRAQAGAGVPQRDAFRGNRRLSSTGLRRAAAGRSERNPGVRVVFLRHVGPYDQVGASWGKLMS